MQNHFTITLFEDNPDQVQYKYYDIATPDNSLPQASAAVQIGTSTLLFPTPFVHLLLVS